MTVNGKPITKEGFLYDGSRFHICNKDEGEPFTDEFIHFYPIEKLEEMYKQCKDPFKFIYDFKTLKTIVGQGEDAVFEQ